MHIAICDDNMADRHQLERLLKKESDKRASSTGILYIDSFGNCNALLSSPMQYAAYYIDICKTDGITGIDVVTKLIAADITSPIILCCSDINYREYKLPDNVIFLEKPIKATELSESIDHVLRIKAQAVPRIELREGKNTAYVTEPDILYAIEDKRHVIVTLTTGQKIYAITNTTNLFAQLKVHPTFLTPSAKVIINGRYIDKLSFCKATMTDGAVLKMNILCMKYARKIYKEYHS